MTNIWIILVLFSHSTTLNWQLQLLYNYSPKGRWIAGWDIYRDAKRPGIYLVLFTDPEGNSCFSIYQISWIKIKKTTFGKLKRHLLGTLFTLYLQTFRGFVKWFLRLLLQIQHENSFLPTSKQFVFFLVFLCTTASFIAQIPSFENVFSNSLIIHKENSKEINV